MNTLKDAIRSAGIERGIIEAEAPVDEKELIAIVKCLGMGPKMDDKSKEMREALKAAKAALEGLLEIEDERISAGMFRPNEAALCRISAAREALAALRPCEGESAAVAIVNEAMGGIEWLLPYRPEFEDRPLYFHPSAERSQDAEINKVRGLIADDAFAMSFQSMGQYRANLLSFIDRCILDDGAQTTEGAK